MQVLLFGDEINEDNSKVILKCKNIRQTGLSKINIYVLWPTRNQYFHTPVG